MQPTNLLTCLASLHLQSHGHLSLLVFGQYDVTFQYGKSLIPCGKLGIPCTYGMLLKVLCWAEFGDISLALAYGTVAEHRAACVSRDVSVWWQLV